MGMWISRSRQGKQLALSVVCIWIGATLAFGFYNQLSSPGMTDGKAGFLGKRSDYIMIYYLVLKLRNGGGVSPLC
jgi:hypothetical protein